MWHANRWFRLVTLVCFLDSTCCSNFTSKPVFEPFSKPDLNSSEPVVLPCSRVAGFARSYATFSLCAITSKELCRSCSASMNGIYDNYFAINSISSNYISPNSNSPKPNSRVCPEEIVSNEKRDDISKFFKQAQDIWLGGNCDSCFERIKIESKDRNSSEFELKYNINAFDDLVEHFDTCLRSSSNKNETCSKCSSMYQDLNEFYEQVSLAFGGNICYEISAAMNKIRTFWSQELLCNVSSSTTGNILVIVIAVTVILTTLVLYVIGRRFMAPPKPSIVIPKRHSMINVGSLDRTSSFERTPLLA